jgi:peptide chain release factor 1
LNKLDRIMNGELADVIDALLIADQTAKLESLKQG